jgi:hypothetical protein
LLYAENAAVAQALLYQNELLNQNVVSEFSLAGSLEEAVLFAKERSIKKLVAVSENEISEVQL